MTQKEEATRNNVNKIVCICLANLCLILETASCLVASPSQLNRAVLFRLPVRPLLAWPPPVSLLTAHLLQDCCYCQGQHQILLLRICVKGRDPSPPPINEQYL